ncbi:NPC intracellular cholesterol transporter 2-like [Dermacentor albipictus]|uniref:NPC intracellular cholesterol transporter 2-like n=1 Tax=Dermacentor albipictus TaxID=60249 RepID=UPI0038FC9120
MVGLSAKVLPLLVVVAAAMASTGSAADSVAFKDCAFTTSSAVNDIGAYIERHRFQLPEPHVDACASGHISPSCPMRKGQMYSYRYTLPVREIYPATPATIEYKLVTQEGKVIGCSQVPVVIFR